MEILMDQEVDLTKKFLLISSFLSSHSFRYRFTQMACRSSKFSRGSAHLHWHLHDRSSRDHRTNTNHSIRRSIFTFSSAFGIKNRYVVSAKKSFWIQFNSIRVLFELKPQ